MRSGIRPKPALGLQVISSPCVAVVGRPFVGFLLYRASAVRPTGQVRDASVRPTFLQRCRGIDDSCKFPPALAESRWIFVNRCSSPLRPRGRPHLPTWGRKGAGCEERGEPNPVGWGAFSVVSALYEQRILMANSSEINPERQRAVRIGRGV
ncbi:hypothetical protein GGS23DRAFT_508673 [Durotheca rogersii]|uniref:uncharacterized protein n=1 Tax=Durotheca rogersii TaxID=419775 RepID=UPI002220705C|nr:uncharacterized protein GGS23DRAFT_508673 [Durotheca rogersii]KAI5863644.1 hypothetical protein GGS23DRAFT_508673 [Durotheca rogersii]